MHFISMNRRDEDAVELKYCERCGGLWLRRQGEEAVMCGPCRARHAALLRGGRGRLPVFGARVECLRGVAEAEVRS